MEKDIQKRLSEELYYCHLKTSEMVKLTGLSARLILSCKKQKNLPTLENFAILCSCLDLSAEYILGLKDI